MSTSSQPPKNETTSTGKSSSTSSGSDLPPDLLLAIRERYLAGEITLLEAYKMKCYYLLEEEDAKDPGREALAAFAMVLMPELKRASGGSTASEESIPAESAPGLQPDLKRFLSKWRGGVRPIRPLTYEEICCLYNFGQIDLNMARRMAGMKESSSIPKEPERVPADFREYVKRLVDGATEVSYTEARDLHDDTIVVKFKVPRTFLAGLSSPDFRKVTNLPPLSQHPMRGYAADMPAKKHPMPAKKITDAHAARLLRSPENPEIPPSTALWGGIRWENQECPDTSANRECTHGSSPSTAGTTSTSTPESRTPSSSSTSSDLSDQESGPKPSSASPDETTGSC